MCRRRRELGSHSCAKIPRSLFPASSACSGRRSGEFCRESTRPPLSPVDAEFDPQKVSIGPCAVIEEGCDASGDGTTIHAGAFIGHGVADRCGLCDSLQRRPSMSAVCSGIVSSFTAARRHRRGRLRLRTRPGTPPKDRSGRHRADRRRCRESEPAPPLTVPALAAPGSARAQRSTTSCRSATTASLASIASSSRRRHLRQHAPGRLCHHGRPGRRGRSS
jgi:hypothetical protein